MGTDRRGTGRRDGRVRAASRLAVVALAVAATQCVPEAFVDVASTVYPEGGVERSLRVLGRTAEGEVPEGSDWARRELSVALARPEGWASVDVEDGVLVARGFFEDAADVPPGLAHHLDDGQVVEDRETIRLRIDDLVVLRRWQYVETHGDPFGPAETTEAVDRILEVAARLLRDDLRLDLGDDVDLSPVDAVVTDLLRPIALEAVQVERRFAATPDEAARPRALASVLERHGVDLAGADLEPFWEGAMPSVVRALAGRLAAALSRPERPVATEDLSLLAAADDPEPWIEAATNRSFGGSDALADRLAPSLAALQGGYGGIVRARFRFRARVLLPGTVVRTNGTPAGREVVWFFPGEELLARDQVLTATSLQLDDAALRTLGARRTFEPADLLRLEHALGPGDATGALRDLLRRAVEAGSLEPLRDSETIPSGLEADAKELAALLDGTALGS